MALRDDEGLIISGIKKRNTKKDSKKYRNILAFVVCEKYGRDKETAILIVDDCISETSRLFSIPDQKVEDTVYTLEYLLKTFLRSSYYLDKARLNKCGFDGEDLSNFFYYETLPSLRWEKEQKIYIKNLKPEELKAIVVYTTESGANFINGYLRNNRVIKDDNYKEFVKYRDYFRESLDLFFGRKIEKEDLTHENAKKYARYLTETIHKVISGAPNSDKDFLVYRGIPGNIFREDKLDLKFTRKGLTSTSLDPERASAFAIDDDAEYTEKVIIPKGSQVLYMEPFSFNPGEEEILIDFNSIFEVVNECVSIEDNQNICVVKYLGNSSGKEQTK